MSNEHSPEHCAESRGSGPLPAPVAGGLAITPEQLQLVQQLLEAHVPELEVRVFGSRAGGRPKRFSDLDLLLLTSHPLEVRRLALLAEAFSESDLPFKVDLLDGSTTDPAFRARVLPSSLVVQQGEALRAR